MTPAEQQIKEALSIVAVAGAIVDGVTPFIDRYEAERDRMDSIGPILAPSLFQSRERQEVDAAIWPALEAARSFARAVAKAQVAITRMSHANG